MASVVKHGEGWRAHCFVRGRRTSKKFRTRREAVAWAAQVEEALSAEASAQPGERQTLADALNRYAAEVSPQKRGTRWEQVRITALLRDEAELVAQLIRTITPEHLGRWRDGRLQQVAAGTVIREMGLLSAVLEHARREWRWIEVNPCRDAKKPRQPEHRQVTLTRAQIRLMLTALGYRPGKPPESVAARCGLIFLFALRSGMRAGEITGLTWDRVRPASCWLPVTKTVPREVPLSLKARRLIELARGLDEALVFGVAAATLDALFRRYRLRAGLSGFVFHDTRHTAATWMARKVDALTLCKIFGWKNASMALVYYNPTAQDIARRL